MASVDGVQERRGKVTQIGVLRGQAMDQMEPDAPGRRVLPHLLLVESDKGWWDGQGGWVQTWGDAAQFEGGAACLEAAGEAERRTGERCRVAFVQRPPLYPTRFAASAA